MARTEEALVGEIIEVDAGQSVAPFILVASELVEEICTPEGYTSTRLEMIERYLAAHLFACSNPRVASESAGPVSASYQQRVGLGLDLTAYGQQVKILDTAGGLAALDAKAKLGIIKKTAKVHFVGGDWSEDRT